MPTPMVSPPSPPALVSLPDDDAPHADYNTEWWYYTGHLQSAEGHRYGFHYVVFQVLAPVGILANLAHVSITDHQEGVYSTDQRASIATSTTEGTPGFSFGLDGWKMSGFDGQDSLQASTSDYAIDLTLETDKKPVLHDHTGLVDFGEAGNSFYYSRTRMSISGTIIAEGQAVPVAGHAWFDHQWGNFEVRALGWDWFALQFDDGSDVMLTALRDESDRPIRSYGTFIAPDGRSAYIAGDEFEVASVDSWTSPVSGAKYPMAWKVRIPNRSIDVVLTPVLVASEFDGTATTYNYYWEGEMGVTGSHEGYGFVELAGYAQIEIHAIVD